MNRPIVVLGAGALGTLLAARMSRTSDRATEAGSQPNAPIPGPSRTPLLGGEDAENFRRSVPELIEQGPSSDDLDAFLTGFSRLMTQPVILH